jgi:hypothetical protein
LGPTQGGPFFAPLSAYPSANWLEMDDQLRIDVDKILWLLKNSLIKNS